jgi:hypothetical protein
MTINKSQGHFFNEVIILFNTSHISQLFPSDDERQLYYLHTNLPYHVSILRGLVYVGKIRI